MILTAYFDESGTHRDSHASVMAGFVADARQWRKFEKRAGKLFKRFGVDIFHTIDVRRTDKDFAGWSVDHKIEFLDEFQHIMNETLEQGVASILRKDDYTYYKNLNWPKGTRPDSEYTLTFRACFACVVDAAITVNRWAHGPEPRLHVVLESGHRNAADAVRVYDYVKGKFEETSKALSGLFFEKKANCLPLAAADLFAYSAYGQEVGQKPIGVPKSQPKSEASYAGNMYRVPLIRDTLDSLHEQAIMLAHERDSASRRGGSARLPS
jgi:hypothetical protein